MSVCKSVLVFISLLFTINLVCSTEFVPVYMWSTSKATEKVPALHKINQDSFKDDVLERLKEDPFVIVFAEQTLSPEDFAQRDVSGDAVYSNLSKLKKATKVTYLPYVQNPIKALKHLDADVVEVPVAELRQSLKIPQSKILIVDLNDAEDDEHRLQMLKRHDADISLIYKELLKTHDNVLVLYTAHHPSWVAPEEVVNSRRTRSVSDTVTPRGFFNTMYALIYYTNATFIADKSVSTNKTELNLTFGDVKNQEGEIVLTGSSQDFEIVFTFSHLPDGYWLLSDLSATHNNTEYALNGTISDIIAPDGGMPFSYHCGDQVFSDLANFEIFFTYFQVQPFFNGTGNTTKFSDAYDCVGFTSVPIWSGIFVTAILLIIMSLGITMMMDIRTMDRFDDAKGKTITINAE